MSDAEQTRPSRPSSPPPLSWPPPGLEKLQGKLWRATGLTWVGSLVLVLPLLWQLAIEQPFWSLGPFEGNWQLGVGIAVLGGIIFLVGFMTLLNLLRNAAKAADEGYGSLTILEVAVDVGRDTGFLIQGRRHFASLDTGYRGRVVRARLRGAVLMLSGALWMAAGFGLGVLLAARGFVTPSGIWLITIAPTALAVAFGGVILLIQNAQVRNARHAWTAQEGEDRVQAEATSWIGKLDEAGDAVALGAGAKEEGGSFRRASLLTLALFLLAVVPTVTVAITATIGPILAEIAVPQFLAVQEMAGAAEVLRRFQVEPDGAITAGQAGAALQNVGFVGFTGSPEPWERRPTASYEQNWFPNPDFFPDPFSETVARELMLRPLQDFSADEQAALLQAHAHPAHAELDVLARAEMVDVVSARWTLPFPDTLSFQSLPWPRFAAYRTAGLAKVARASVEVSRGNVQGAEQILRELVSTGFLLIDQGPTLIDNLLGVQLANMGGDALEGFYERTGRAEQAEALAWAREGAADAARMSRAGLIAENIHSLLEGIPDLVVEGEALRGLRWEYFATFNRLAPCINAHKMVFGPDETYDDWRIEARDELVRVPGESQLFDLAEGTAFGGVAGQDLEGFLPRFLSLTLGRGGSPGSCASLIASIQARGSL